MVNRKINKKKSFLTRDFVMAGILFSGIVALFVLMVAGIQSEYDSTLLTDEEFADTYNKLEAQAGKISTARSAAATGEGLTFIGTFDVAFQSTFTVIQMIWSTLDLFGNMTDSFALDFGLDPTIVDIVFTVALVLLTISLVWTWISSISRGKI